MTNFILFLLLTISFVPTSSQANACLTHKQHAFASIGGDYDNGYPQSKYNEVLQTFKDIYGPTIEEHGGTFHIQSDWSDGAVNMWAWRWGDQFWLEIPGGMSRYYLINEEAFVLSICHELGHLLGGPPLKGEYISLEGQSDYYSTSGCVQRMLVAIRPYKNLPSNNEIDEFCRGTNDQALCRRISKGALSLTSYYAKLEKVSFPKISTPSIVVVSQTLRTHPPAQCRLDTFIAGLKNQPRPKCWYKK